MRVDLALRRSLIYLLPLALLFFALGMRVAASDLLERLSLLCFDLYQQAAPRVAGDVPIRVVDIDDPSLKKIGQWPWPRTVIAQLVDRLREAGAAVIAFDIDFAEPDRTSPKLLLPLLAQNGVGGEEAERILVALPDPDKRLAEAIHALPVVIGFILTDRVQARPPACEGRLCFGRRRPAGPCRQLFRGGFEPAGTGSGGRRKWVPQPICRLGPCRSPGAADFAARRKAVSVARRRDASGRPRRAQLHRPCGWSKHREEFRRKDRVDGDPHRTADDTDRSRRPSLASLRCAAARPVRLCRRRLGGEIRSRPLRRSHRIGRNLGCGCRQRSAGDADRPRRSRSRDPRPAAGADTTRGISRSAGLGGRGGNPVHAAGRDRSDPELAADRRVAQRDPRRCFDGCCVRGLVARSSNMHNC